MDWLFKWMIEKAKDYVLRNWKTTVVGVIGAVLTQVPSLAPYKETIVAAVLAILGVVAKDGDKTGTTASTAQPLNLGPPVGPPPLEPADATPGG